ncbi:hypothetical protein CspHIS471_0102970 [Cutaneotrichosporon sp. HIS471]|nr:hypothetical protein CspHIS471_0102970 [Cutaneotrichosporon sp. HIS471]
MKGYPRSGKGDCFISHQHKREIVRMYRVLHEAGVLHTAEKDQQRHWLSMPTPALKQLNLKYATSQKPTGRKSKTEPTQPTANPIRLTDFTRSRVCNSVKYVPPSLRWSALDQHDFDSFTKCEGGEWGYVVYDLGMNPSEARELYQDT